MAATESSYGLQHPRSLGVKGKKRYVMVIDLKKCSGCMSCTVACKVEHDVPLGVWRTWVKVVDKGVYPDVRRQFIPRLCNHCDYPICVRACPVQATYKHESGFVLQRYNRCIGCRSCMIACPFNARHLLPEARTNPNDPFFVADKCDFCVFRVTRGLAPVCVTTCEGGAMTFGDINDPESEVHRLVSIYPTTVLRPEIGTYPQVYYIGLEDMDIEESYEPEHRVAQIKEEFDTFKLNHKGGQHGDLVENDTGFWGMWRQISRNQWNFAKEIPEKISLLFGKSGKGH